MFITTRKIARSCQSGLATSLRWLLGSQDGSPASRRAPLRSAQNGNGQRADEPGSEPLLAVNGHEPCPSLSSEDANTSAMLTTQKLSPGVIRQLHEALDDLASDLPTDPTD